MVLARRASINTIARVLMDSLEHAVKLIIASIAHATVAFATAQRSGVIVSLAILG